jgi:hypothetical protein
VKRLFGILRAGPAASKLPGTRRPPGRGPAPDARTVHCVGNGPVPRRAPIMAAGLRLRTAMPEPLVFVYGSLRRGAFAHGRLRPAALRLGSASVAGCLYDLGPYPAARPARRPAERVQGER